MRFPTARLEDVIETLIDYRGKTPTKTSAGVRLITAKVIKDGFINDSSFEYVAESEYDSWMRRGLPKQGDLLVTTEAPLGEVARIVDERVALAQRVILLRADRRKMNPRFLFHAFKSSFVQAELRKRATGTTVLGIKQSELREIQVPSPSLSTQQRISDVLSPYDDLIENNTKRIKILEEMALSIYREAFASARYAGDESRPLAQELIDQGVLEINDGYRAKNSELGRPGLPFARAGNVDAGFHFADADCLAESNLVKVGMKVSRPADIVFTSKGTVGRFAWVSPRTPTFVYSPQLCFWRVLRPELLEPAYLFRWMRSSAFLVQVNQVKGSSDMADYVSLTNQKRMRVNLPPRATQKWFAETVAPLDGLIENLRVRNDSLRSTLDLLLPRLLSGEIEVHP